LGAEVLGGQIFGVAGLLVGLSRLRGLKSFCLLAETPGSYPDKEAARAVLKPIAGILGLKLDLADVTEAIETASVLAPFDFGALSEKPKKETKPGWFI
jgi:proteasome assembly chaperone (PAC2) family protein